VKLAESMAGSSVEEADDDEHEPERRGMLADYQREQEDGVVHEHARP
jgi:UMF1 family MFS transporter